MKRINKNLIQTHNNRIISFLKYSSFTLAMLLSLTNIASSQYWMKTYVPSPYNTNHWLDVYFLPNDPNYGWVCGFSGMVLRSTDGGLTWQGAGISSAYQLESIFFTSRTTGYCSGVEGVYKSIDGGKSWTEISPDTSISYWGLHFVNDNIGVVLSGGCLNNVQKFFRTTDGGSTWSLFEAYEVNSGLTDPVLYSANGLGYASSSGRIWKTVNGGVTWSIHSVTGTNVWAEELAHIGNSFLVPYAGSTCIGDKSTGGTRFSTDDGASWYSTDMGRPMYGTFLINETTGWAVGDNSALYYTTNAGRNWELRNCGITGGNLDDIYFLNESTGWVVGNTGVYKLAPDKHTVSNTNFTFSELCIPNNETQPFWIANWSFFPTNVLLSKFADDDNSFSISAPDTLFTLNPCDSVRVYLKFEPKSEGLKTANYRVSFNGVEEFTLNLSGTGMISRAVVNDTLLVINPAYCGRTNRDSLLWTTLSPFNEVITEIRPIEGTYQNKLERTPPIHLSSKEQAMIFSVNPPDTGWYNTRFLVTLMPCKVDTFVTVRAYGVSPIINAEKQRSMMLECKKTTLDTIPVYNTGNDTLTINNMQVLQNPDIFSIVGWTSGYKNMTRIPPGKADSLLIRFLPRKTIEYSTTIRLLNDDKTTKRGTMSPYDISITADFSTTEVFVQDSIIDFGKICVGTEKEATIIFGNNGDKDAFIEYPKFQTKNFYTARLKEDFPVLLASGRSAEVKLLFHPNTAGLFRDTLHFNTKPCFENVVIIVSGYGIDTKLQANPSSFIDTVSVNEILKIDVNIKSIGSSHAKISRIELEPQNPDWNFSYKPDIPIVLDSAQEQVFNFEFVSSKESYLNSKICFYTEETCPSKTCVPVEIVNRNRFFVAEPEYSNFDYQTCIKQVETKDIDITNYGIVNDSIVEISLEPEDAGFRIIDMPTLPKAFDRLEKAKVTIEYFPLNEGAHKADLIIKSFDPGGQTLVVPLSGEFRTVNTTPESTTFNFLNYEVCDDDVEKAITFKNSGTLDDTLIITRKTNIKGLYIEPEAFIGVPALDSSICFIRFKPSEFPETGMFSDTFLLESKVCDQINEVIVNISIVRPRLTINPKAIDFGDVWHGDAANDTIFVENNTDFDKSIIGFTFKPQDTQIKALVNYPILIPARNKSLIPLMFTALQEGEFHYDFDIIEKSVCIDTTNINIKANVPEERYNSLIRIGDYTAKPGEILTIALELIDTVKRISPNSIYYEIAFDEKLFKPYSVALSDFLGGKSLSFNYAAGTLSGRIPSPEANFTFHHAGTILNITGKTFFSMPDTTGLFIKEFLPETDKVIDIKKEDGFLDLYGFCMPFGYEKIPVYSINIINQIINSNALSLSINSTEIQRLDVQLINILSDVIKNVSLLTTKGNANYSIDISNIPSGTYFIYIKSEFNLIQRTKFVVLK